MQQSWSAVDEYVASRLAPEDADLAAAVHASEDAGLPPIQVSAPQGKLLCLLARSIGARRILEFGTLGAYSTIWLGWALPEGGRLITLEADPGYAEVARANISGAGLEGLVDLRVGPALDVLPQLKEEAAFDFTFIDADKENSPAYFAWALIWTPVCQALNHQRPAESGPFSWPRRRRSAWCATRGQADMRGLATAGPGFVIAPAV